MRCPIRRRGLRDTRPFRGRPAIAYAGCMTVVRTAAIESVYSSGPSHRSGLWVGRPTCEFVGHLVQFSREAGRGLAQSNTRWPRWPNGTSGLLVTPLTRWPDCGAGWPPCSGPLDSSLRWNDGRSAGLLPLLSIPADPVLQTTKRFLRRAEFAEQFVARDGLLQRSQLVDIRKDGDAALT